MMRRALATALGIALLGVARAVPAEPELRFEPPAPGTYRLPAIDRIEDHELLGTDGAPARLLAGLRPGGVALISLIYRSCSDAQGCPLALATLKAVDTALAQEPEIRQRLQLVTVSFDPAHDDAAKMAQLERMMSPRGAWSFLTAGSEAALVPVLEDFGQDVTSVVTADGAPTRKLRHVLKIFLVDAGRGVRNIYSPGLLHSKLVTNDIRTLLLEADASAHDPH